MIPGFKVKIKVTGPDIAKGTRRSHRACPIALAATRAGIPSPVVGYDCIDSLGQHWLVPDRIIDWMKRFDEGKGVKAIEFEAIECSAVSRRYNGQNI